MDRPAAWNRVSGESRSMVYAPPQVRSRAAYDRRACLQSYFQGCQGQAGLCLPPLEVSWIRAPRMKDTQDLQGHVVGCPDSDSWRAFTSQPWVGSRAMSLNPRGAKSRE